jgi:hypothetical protein
MSGFFFQMLPMEKTQILQEFVKVYIDFLLMIAVLLTFSFSSLSSGSGEIAPKCSRAAADEDVSNKQQSKKKKTYFCISLYFSFWFSSFIYRILQQNWSERFRL